MVHKENETSRRNVLKLSAAGLAALTGAGSAQAARSGESPASAGPSDKTDAIGGSSQSSDRKQHTKAEYERDLADLGLESQVGTMASSPGDPTREHLEYLDHRKETGVLDSGIMKIADVEWMLTVWEAINDSGTPLTDSNGDYYYVLEYLAVSDEVGAWWRNDGQTSYLLVEADLSSSASMEARDPRTTHSVNGGWVTVSVGATVGGYGVNAATEQWVEHGDYGPENWTPGPAGNYGVMFDGESPGGGQTDIIGFTSVTQSYQASNIWSIVDEWSWEAKGNHIAG